MLKHFTLLIGLIIPQLLSGQLSSGIMGGGSLSDQVIVRGAIPFEIQRNDLLSYQVELAFSLRGNKKVLRQIDFNAERAAKSISFVEIPLLVKVGLPVENIKPYLVGGVQFGYGLNVRTEYRRGTEYFKESYSFEEANLSRYDGGVTFGVGLLKTIAKERSIFIDFRYYLGLVNLDRSNSAEIYNEGVTLSLGFSIPFNQKKQSPQNNK